MADKPVTREEKYLAYLAGDYTGEIPKPITRKEKYLYELCLKGIGGEISPEEIKAAVNEYLEKNPVKPGATTEQAQQIEQNKADVASLKEDISNKITKFYASNQGEAHITDSDNGKIQDMMIYGKSSQDGTPTTDNPVEIKSVVNPTIKLLGSNILKIMDGEYQRDGVTVIVSNGVVKLKGTAKTEVNILFTGSIVFKEGTKIIFSPNKTNDMEEPNTVYLGFTNNTTIGFSIRNNNINTPYIIKKEDAQYPFNLFIKILARTNFDETWKPQVLIGETSTVFKPYIEQTVTLPITLNAIPVSSGGNVTIDGQQYIADYVDVERGKVVRNIENATFNGAENENWELWNADKEKMWSFIFKNSVKTFVNESASKCNRFEFEANENIDKTFWLCNPSGKPSLQIRNRIIGKDITAFKSWLSNNPIDVIYPLRIPIEEELTAEHAQALKELATYYPVTNISIGSEQLDGYTVFNYPISMANGWNYVKQQLNDNRDYIYDMDTQSAEAYVNSEYAVALTELEV